MISFVLLRLRAQRLLIAAALLTVLLSTCVLATLAGFSSSVGDAAVQRALQSTDGSATPLLLQAELGYQATAKAQATARSIAARAYPGLPFELSSLVQSDPFSLPVQPGTAGSTSQDSTLLASLPRTKLRLLQGSWPDQASAPKGTVPVAVPSAALKRLGVPLGSVLTLRDVLNRHPVRITLVGVYAARDGDDRYWQLDPVHGKGSTAEGSNTTYGPLLVDDRSFASGAVSQDTLSVLAVADFSRVRVGDLDALAAADARTVAALSGSPGSGSAGGFTASSQLAALLLQLKQSVLVARSTLLVGVLQLVLLAGFTLLLAARLLAEEREPENALLRARGATSGRVGSFAALEVAVLVLPSLVLAPLLAGPLIRLLAAHGPTARAGLRLDGPLPPSVVWAALLSAVLCAAMMLGPTVLRGRAENRTGGQPRPSSRRAALPGVMRGGVDVALIGLAAVAYWQLEHTSGQGAVSGTGGGLGVDPVLVAAPTLVLLAGTVTALRLLPLAARLAERLVSRLSGLPGALVGWQLSRRPQQGAGPVVVLALATAIGILALGQNASWSHSQADQATFDTGGDVRIADTSTAAFGQGGVFAAVPGVTAAVPVARSSLSLPAGRTGELLALDTRTEAGLLDWRPDLTGGNGSAAQLLRPLADPPLPPSQQGIRLPGRPGTLTVAISAALADTRGRPVSAARMNKPDDRMVLTLTDRYGLSYTLDPRTVPLDGATHDYAFDLIAPADGGVPAYPLTISSLSVVAPVSQGSAVVQAFAVHAVRSTQAADPAGPAATTPLPTGLSWKAAFNAGSGDPSQDSGPLTTAVYVPGGLRSVAGDAGTPLTLTIDSGRIYAPEDGFLASPDVASTTVLTAKAPPGRDGPLPALVDQAFLDATGSQVGSVVGLADGAGSVRIRVTAVVGAIPGTGAGAEQGIDGAGPLQGAGIAGATPATYGGTVLVDLASYDRRALAGTDAAVLQPREWWLSTAPGQAAQDRVADALRALPGVQAVYARDATEAALTADPLGSGSQAALFAAMALAVLLAAVGFSMGAAAVLRQQQGETAVLRALGAARHLLARATTARLVLPVLVGVGIGIGLGEALTRLVVPLLVLTPQAARPVPPVLVHIPGGQLGLLVLAVGSVPLLVAALAGLRGGDPARELRDPEAS